MGLFSRHGKDDSYTKRRQFSLPYDQAMVLKLITTELDMELFNEAPIVETVYFSQVTAERVVVTAGNRLKTYWNVIVELAPRDDGTAGVVYVDRPKDQVEKWWGNINNIVPDLYLRLRSAGATFQNWQGTDIFN